MPTDQASRVARRYAAFIPHPIDDIANVVDRETNLPQLLQTLRALEAHVARITQEKAELLEAAEAVMPWMSVMASDHPEAYVKTVALRAAITQARPQ